MKLSKVTNSIWIIRIAWLVVATALTLSFLVLSSCSPKEYYWLSVIAYDRTSDYISAGLTTAHHQTVDDYEFTIKASKSYVDSIYRKQFPDVILVKRKNIGKGVIKYHK